MADNTNHDELIQTLSGITGADPHTCRHFLEATNWNLQLATEQFFENDEDMGIAPAAEDEDDDDELYASPSPAAFARTTQSSSASKPKPKPKSTGSAKIRTLGDLSSRDEEDDEDEDDRGRGDLFAGGEKSGLAVQDPGRHGHGHGHGSGPVGLDVVQDILRRAAEGGQRRRPEDVEEAPSRPRFTGSGHTLGSDTTESVTIPDPHAVVAPPRAPVVRTLIFWRDGFSVEDGPLLRYDDPANREILQAIESGRAPLSVMNVEPGQPTEVNVFKRLDEDYIPPKKKFVPFHGQGQRLGAVVAGSSSQPAAPAAQPAAPTTAAAPAPPTVNVDSSAPSTSIQIRLGDGTRMVSRFNHTHTVGDVYSFVNSASVASRSRNYVLQTTFPSKELTDRSQTIKDAGLINAVVVQKWSS